jgi:hypothetical protein
MDDFSSFFTDYLVEALTPLEKQRKRILTGKFTILITMSLLIVLNLFLYHFRASWYPIALPFWSLFVTIPSIALFSEIIYRHFFSGTEKLNNDFKTLILAKMLDYLGPSFSFFPEEHIPYKHFKQSHLFLIKPDHYSGDDMVTGNIGGVNIQFSELDVGYQTTNEKEQKDWHVIFRGMFFVATVPTPFPTNVSIFPDHNRKFFKRQGRNIQKLNHIHKGKQVLIHNKEFNDEYVVYADNPALAREVITDYLIGKIMDFHKSSHYRPYMSFQGDKIFVAVEFGHELFEMNIRKSFLNQSYIRGFFDDLAFGTNIANILGFEINQRFENETNYSDDSISMEDMGMDMDMGESYQNYDE